MSRIVIQRKGGYTIRGHGGGGGKGGGGAGDRPTEAPDSLHSISYAHVLMNVGIGEYEGFVTSDPLRSIFLNGTPIANDDGSINFPGVEVDYRAGTVNQDPIEGFTASESTSTVGVELRSDAPWTQLITDTELSAIRITLGVNGLTQTDLNTGKINGYRVDYSIDVSTDGGSFVNVLNSAFAGKKTSKYQKSHRIQLPPSTTGWTVRVRRTTPNSGSATISDTTTIDFVSLIVDGRFRWPMAALIAVKVDAAQFSSIPQLSAHLKLRRIRVPSNYDPESRTYSGTWDGTFKTAYSNNPAWTFFDICTNELFGLGDRIPAGTIDRYALYTIGQYCDELVPDGKGGMEPRFTCNSFIQSQADAWRVVQDYASIFRGLAYYASDSVWPVADMPKDAVYTYSNSNVIDGRFNYVGTSRDTRYTSCTVSWNDLTDQGRAKIEPVSDRPGIRRYGIVSKDLTLFGCTSQGQAQRAGRWFLYTSLRETSALTFSVGLEGVRAVPGQIIKIADRNRAGRRIGGRISFQTFEYVTVNGELVTVSGDPVTVELPEGSALSASAVTIDSDAIINPGDQFTVVLPSGITETRTVTQSSNRIVQVDPPFSDIPQPGAQWLVESEELAAQLYRVLDVAEDEGEDKISFTISAVQHVPGKFLAIDSETNVQTPPITVIPPTVQPPPTNVTIQSYSTIKQGITIESAIIEWERPEGAAFYNVQWKRDNSDWVTVARVPTQSYEIENAYAGLYLVRVQAVNALGIASLWADSVATPIDGILGAPPVVTTLTATGIVFGIKLDWGIPSGPSIVEKTEIWYSTTDDRENAIKLGDFAFPQITHNLMGLSAGQTFYFWARLVDKNGTIGDWYPATNGVIGSSLSAAGTDVIFSYLDGKITATQLSQALLDEIASGGESAVIVEALVNQLAAMYTIKTQITVDGRTYVAGIGVGVENNEGEIESQVLVAADRFAVLDPDQAGSATPVFVVQGGQVFLRDAIIGNASIGSAKFADWLESDAVNNANVPLIRINFRTGAFELNDTDGGGIKQQGKKFQVFDESLVERVLIGKLN